MILKLFSKSEPLVSTIPKSINEFGEKYSIVNYGEQQWSSDFSLEEISIIDDHINGKSIVGFGESDDLYLPIVFNEKAEAKKNNSLRKFSIVLIAQDNVKKQCKNHLTKFNLDDLCLLNDYNTYLSGNGLAELNLSNYSNLSLFVRLSFELFEKIESAIKEKAIDKLRLEIVFFNLYKCESDPQDSNTYYLTNSLGESSFSSFGFLNNLVIESHKTKLT